MALLEQVDDTDARIKYSSGQWFVGGNPEEYNHTSHGTNSEGAVATFKFKGTSLKVFGTVEVGIFPFLSSPTSSYAIDNEKPTMHHDSDLVSLPQTLYNQLFFQTSVPMDPDVEHTLVITLLSPGSNLWIDKIDVGTSESSSTVLSTTQVSSTVPSPQETQSPSIVVVTTSITTSRLSTSTSPTSIFRLSPESSTSESSDSKSLASKSSATKSSTAPQSQFSSSFSFSTSTDNHIAGVASTTSSQTSSATDLASTPHKRISEGATIGIVLGVCIPVVTIIIGIFYLRMRRGKKTVYQSLIPPYPIRSDWPTPKTTNTTSTDVVPSSAGGNISMQTSRWEIIEPFPLHHGNINSFSGAPSSH